MAVGAVGELGCSRMAVGAVGELGCSRMAVVRLVAYLFHNMFSHSQTLPKGGPPTLVLSGHDIRVIVTLYGFLGLLAALGCGRSAPAVLACRRPPGRQLADRCLPL